MAAAQAHSQSVVVGVSVRGSGCTGSLDADQIWVRATIKCNTQTLPGPERVPKIKTPVTVRIEAGLLGELRQLARDENRTLTNLIETVLRQRLAGEVLSSSVRKTKAVPARAAKRNKDKPTNAA